MTEDFTIRVAGKDDLPELLSLYAQLHRGEKTLPVDEAEGIFNQFSLLPGNTLLLGVLGDIAVSTCALAVIPNLTRGGAPYALIENVVTNSRYQKRGFGKAVLNAAISIAWEHQCYKVMLLTGTKDPGTLEFYRSVGFRNSKTGFQIRRNQVD